MKSSLFHRHNRPEQIDSDSSIGIVLTSSRRFAHLLDSSGAVILGTLASRKVEVAVGDYVEFQARTVSADETSAEIIKIIDRKNLLKRSYERKTKLLAANLDMLFIVTAPPPLCNLLAIDRVLCAATSESIPVTIIANKADLYTYSELETIISYYEKISIPVLRTSALKEKGLNDIRNIVSDEDNRIFAFAGISGVGKSSLIKAMFPDLLIRTGDVSEKTGQGKQTTSSAQGHPLSFEIKDSSKSESMQSILIDLPGIQQYGVSHLAIENIQHGMPDINEQAQSCRFSDCTHDKEPGCSVKEALQSGIITQSRFDSYQDMRKEILTHTSY